MFQQNLLVIFCGTHHIIYWILECLSRRQFNAAWRERDYVESVALELKKMESFHNLDYTVVITVVYLLSIHNCFFLIDKYSVSTNTRKLVLGQLC